MQGDRFKFCGKYLLNLNDTFSFLKYFYYQIKLNDKQRSKQGDRQTDTDKEAKNERNRQTDRQIQTDRQASFYWGYIICIILTF